MFLAKEPKGPPYADDIDRLPVSVEDENATMRDLFQLPVSVFVKFIRNHSTCPECAPGTASVNVKAHLRKVSRRCYGEG